jgi:hypothetical protein
MDVLRTLRRYSPKPREIEVQMRVFGFIRTVAPYRSVFSIRKIPWVTCAERLGNSEDFARLWATVLRHPKGRSRFLYVERNDGEYEVMLVYSLGGVSWLLFGPKVLTDVFDSKVDSLRTYLYGERTARSVMY